MAERVRYRTHQVGCTLSDEEYRHLCEVKVALQLTTRDLLRLAIRRAKRILAEEQRRQP